MPGSLARDGDLFTIGAMPGWNAMAPPQLARDAQVANVAHPFVINGLPVFGRHLDSAGFDGFNCRLSERLHLYEPLRGGARFDDGAAAVAGADRMRVLDYFFEQAGSLNVFDGFFARFEAI